MALGTSVALAEKILDLIFNQASVTMPTTVYVGLSSTLPNRDGTNITEPSGGGYARQQVSAANWTAAATAADVTSVTNSAQVTFPTATANWGTFNYVVYYQHATSTAGSDYLGSDQLATARTINNGDIAQFPANSLVKVAR